MFSLSNFAPADTASHAELRVLTAELNRLVDEYRKERSEARKQELWGQITAKKLEVEERVLQERR